MDKTHPPKKPEVKAYDIPSFITAYNIGRSTAYKEMREGRLKYIKVGARTLIPVEAAEAWLKLFSAN